MRSIVIIPAYNEAQKIHSVVLSVIEKGFDVVVVDDGSFDNTESEARSAGAIVLKHIINRGYGAALSTGNSWAVLNNYQIIVHFDADGQHSFDEIEKVISPIKENKADIVIGSRFKDEKVDIDSKIIKDKNFPFLRKFLIKIAVLFTWVVSGIKLTDAHNGFRAFRAEKLKLLDCRQDGMSYSSEIIDQISKQKLKVLEVPVTIEYSDYSKSKGEGNAKKVILGLKFLWGKVIK